jgi:urease accessory protein
MNAIPRIPASLRTQGAIRASFRAENERTFLGALHESGGWRLKHPRAAAGYEAVILNSGGGLASGDRVDLAFSIAAHADVTVTTQAAEKVYRGPPAAQSNVSLDLQPAARLDYLPQETILFGGAELRRRFAVDMAADATLLMVEMIVFGRLARGETAIEGAFHDSWRIRRAGALVFADETRLEGRIGDVLDRPAVGKGARATALLLFIAPEAPASLDALRDEFAQCSDLGSDLVEAGASAFNGLVVARFAAPSPEPLRAVILAAMTRLRGRAPPRVWL